VFLRHPQLRGDRHRINFHLHGRGTKEVFREHGRRKQASQEAFLRPFLAIDFLPLEESCIHYRSFLKRLYLKIYKHVIVSSRPAWAT
jgi:hypothetical protein